MIHLDTVANRVATALCVQCGAPTNFVPVGWATGRRFASGELRATTSSNMRCDDCIDLLPRSRLSPPSSW
ncbi:hypothetical protein [Nocardia bovistercoris]|uniref:Uncharacterized protein n=1 Tax=Nocardia bovistercoris TaxID=2785916 RepID=A0A931ICD0_9NOCA|nr:hypothetical protein [Nocardia bovistercoris]MBH0778809.1 hypothetical protein [Nocardia bovistercoris]